MKRVKQKIESGAVLEQLIFNVSENIPARKAKLRPRFANAEDYAAFKDAEGLKRFIRLINANFTPKSLKGTLTFDDDHECHTFGEAKAARNAYVRRIRRRYPNAKIVIFMGRARSVKSRIHLHYIMDGVPENDIRALWGYGEIAEVERLRAHNFYDGIDCGADYKGIATYYWRHWTPEQGRNHYYATRNLEQPKKSAPEEIKRDYTVTKPPRTPKGYVLVESTATRWGYLYFKYVKIIETAKTRKTTAAEGSRGEPCI